MASLKWALILPIVLTMDCDYIYASFGPPTHANYRPPHQITFAFLLFFSFLKAPLLRLESSLVKRWLELGLAFTWTAKDVGSAFGGFPSVQSIQAAENHNKMEFRKACKEKTLWYNGKRSAWE